MPTIFNLELAWNKPAKNWKESSEHILRVRINSSSDRQYGLPLRMLSFLKLIQDGNILVLLQDDRPIAEIKPIK